jgi:hypothetical protein
MTSDAMLFAIEKIIPLLGDAIVLSNRQGAAEAIYRMCSVFFMFCHSYLAQISSSTSTSKHFPTSFFLSSLFWGA